MPMYNCTCKYLGTCMKFFKNISKDDHFRIHMYFGLERESINQSRILHSMDEFFSLVFHWLEIHLCSSVVRVP